MICTVCGAGYSNTPNRNNTDGMWYCHCGGELRARRAHHSPEEKERTCIWCDNNFLEIEGKLDRFGTLVCPECYAEEQRELSSPRVPEILAVALA